MVTFDSDSYVFTIYYIVSLVTEVHDIAGVIYHLVVIVSTFILSTYPNREDYTRFK